MKESKKNTQRPSQGNDQGGETGIYTMLEKAQAKGPDMSLGDALLALEYLGRRNVLCTRCGHRIVEHVNMSAMHCDTCKRQGVEYHAATGISYFDRVLAHRVAEWMPTYFAEGSGPTANSRG